MRPVLPCKLLKNVDSGNTLLDKITRISTAVKITYRRHNLNGRIYDSFLRICKKMLVMWMEAHRSSSAF